MDDNFRGSRAVEAFYKCIERGIDAEGVYPQVGVALMADQTLELWALALNAEEIIAHVHIAMTTRPIAELVFGLDRTTKPGQGTEFADVITLLWWNGTEWISGVIDYQHEPRLVRPINWDNEFWNRHHKAVAARLKPFVRAFDADGNDIIGVRSVGGSKS